MIGICEDKRRIINALRAAADGCEIIALSESPIQQPRPSGGGGAGRRVEYMSYGVMQVESR